MRSQSEQAAEISHALRGELEIHHAPGDKSWQPGQLHPHLSWTHYRTLLRVEKPEARSFYALHVGRGAVEKDFHQPLQAAPAHGGGVEDGTIARVAQRQSRRRPLHQDREKNQAMNPDPS